MKVGETLNAYGTPVSLHRCCYCGNSFTVTPARDNAFGLGCLSDKCASYDLARDVDIFFEAAQEAGIIKRGEVHA